MEKNPGWETREKRGEGFSPTPSKTRERTRGGKSPKKKKLRSGRVMGERKTPPVFQGEKTQQSALEQKEKQRWGFRAVSREGRATGLWAERRKKA